MELSFPNLLRVMERHRRQLAGNAGVGAQKDDADFAVKECTFEQLVPGFLVYARRMLRLAESTVTKYKECLGWVQRDLAGLRSPLQLSKAGVLRLIEKIDARGAGPSRTNSILYSLKIFLSYCKDFQGLSVVDPKIIKPRGIRRKQVIFLTKREVKRFLNRIPAGTMQGLRFRALAETLLGTAARISEVLSLNRGDIDWKKGKATIIGKSGKIRVLNFSVRSMLWLKEYLSRRTDSHPALFVTFPKKAGREIGRLRQYDLSKQFKHYAKAAALEKKVTPHVLRRTAATTAEQNGADIWAVSQILGHARIETTARYYSGIDDEAVRRAHRKYINYDC